VKEIEEIETPIEEAETDDPPPMDDNLGIDAEGGAGSDSFGLLGKKGGAPVIGGGGRSLMTQYAWYNQIVEKELRRRVDELLNRGGGIPQGSFKAVVNVFLDEQGQVVRSSLHAASGNPRLDDAIQEAMQQLRISQRPPEGMPRGLRIAITSKG